MQNCYSMQNNVKSPAQIKSFKKLIIVLSIFIPLAVALLFGIKVDGLDFSFLPPIYATINGITAILLVSAVIAVKNKKITLHQNLLKTPCLVHLLFLFCKVLFKLS